jgi:DNA uptake protein ComE-like DNA-binding protein
MSVVAEISMKRLPFSTARRSTGREQWAPRKLDVNSATVAELAGIPGLERRHAQRITSNHPMRSRMTWRVPAQR